MKKLLPLLLIPTLLLSGCTSLDGALGTSVFQQAETIHEEKTPIRFSWWGNDNRHEYTMNGIGIFEDQNPTIKVKNSYGVWQGFEKRMRVAMESHTESDVMQINYAWIDQYSPDGTGFYDLYELADYIDLSNFDDVDLQYGVKNGKLNALPIAFNSYEFYYNKAIWDKYGLEFPKNWDEAFAAAEVMQKDGIYPFGYVKKQAFMVALTWFEQTHGKCVFTDEGKLNINSDELGEMLEFYRDMIDKKLMMPIDDFDKGKFADGSVAATMCWVSDAGNYCSSLEKKGGVPAIAGYIIPEDAKLTGWYIKPATMYAISSYTEHPEEAAKLLDFLINSPEMATLQKAEKGVPVSKSAKTTVENIPGEDMGYELLASDYMNENIEKLAIIKPVMENDEIISAFKSYGDEYIFGKMTLKECSEQLYADILEVTGE